MTLTDPAIAAALAPAGLQFMERLRSEVRLPLPAGTSAATCRPEDGRFDSHPDEIVDVDNAEMADKVNAGWWRMAYEYGLFDSQREFLLAVDCRDSGATEPETQWVKVRLLEKWDLARSGVPLLRSGLANLFTDTYVPEFTMMSCDGQMLMNTTVWGGGTVSTIVIRPDRVR